MFNKALKQENRILRLTNDVLKQHTELLFKMYGEQRKELENISLEIQKLKG